MVSKRDYLALINGKIISIDSQDRIFDAVLISGDKIMAVGTNDQILELLPSTGTKIDLGGRAVIPGIIDGHVHVELTVNSLMNAVNVQTPPFESLEQMLNEIKKKAAETSKGEWIIARTSNDFPKKIGGRLPTRNELDAVAPDHPVLLNMEVHLSVMNTLAINTLGWTQESTIPKNATLGRDLETGELSGVYTEAWEQLPLTPWGYDRMLEALRIGTVEHFVKNGVTSVHELPYSSDGIRGWQQLKREGELPLRLRFYLQHPDLINLDEFLRTGIQSGYGDEWLSFGGLKLFADGIGLHANMHPLEDMKYSRTELEEIVMKAHAAGLQIWTHVSTETGLDWGISAYEKALECYPRKDHRLRLEHAGERISLFSNGEQQIERMKNAGIVPIVTPQFTHSLPDFVRPTLRSYIQQGFILPGNSDATGSQPEACNPWHSIWVAVTGENFYGETKLPHECITPLQAIRMFTHWAAWGGFEEKVKGSIEPGKLADLVVLGKDPLSCDPDELRTMPVEMVMIGGSVKVTSPDFKGIENLVMK
jgi:predicted amidohydrolase YtcJ